MKYKEQDRNGVILSQAEIDTCEAWLAMEDAKPFKKIIAGMTTIAEMNSRQDPKPGVQVDLFLMQREQYLGGRKELAKIASLYASK